ncbi:N-6 DNA methylase [Mesorhizobium sp. INR15]|uniref:N-6 DNA methylase n=1 Tax=Mesorhizobium sp. INR15 TaxID=2654248 RepID=UPI0018966072|nr:N-6 DNA methylase [Mesorhizobium sp. INR15]QPC89927.1 N-6 DNA methylase [Mesorhizobium sp. INR15]
MTDSISVDWGRRFGLACSPLFEAGEIERPNLHAALLDGGNGSFILSQSPARLDPKMIASWAWSASMPNHVTLMPDEVLVTRWDNPHGNDRFSLKSVTNKLDAFYDFLSTPKYSGRRDVVTTLVDLFRSVRGEVEAAGAPDEASVSEYLDILATFVASERGQGQAHQDFLTQWANARDPNALVQVINNARRERLEVGFKSQIEALTALDLSVSLAVRHAASAIFQEAHFAFQSSAQSDLFGYQPSSASKQVSRGAHHFTPPSLARTIVEQALTALSDVAGRKLLTVCDPACGSGVFLTETARALRRLGYKGRLRLIGRDLSPAAVQMARFALHATRSDWAPEGGIEIDVQTADSLEAGAIPPADLILMNPPFLAWPMMSDLQKTKVSELLGSTSNFRPDISMVFVTQALSAISKGGVVASLLPSSILTLESGRQWRTELLDQSRLAFLGSFGEYGLFVHALVSVAAIILVSGDFQQNGIALRSGNKAKATGEALRALRKLNGPLIAGFSGDAWRISPLDQRTFAKSDGWKVLPAPVETALRRLEELGIPVVEDLFDVRQGLLTGKNDVFILSAAQRLELPTKERKFFRPGTFRDSILNARAYEKYFVFFPYTSSGLAFKDEAELQAHVPNYFGDYLLPHREDLEKRSGVGSDGKPWWALSRYYKWVQRGESRIITKYFGSIGDFVFDESANFVPLHGYAWFRKGTDRSHGNFAHKSLMKGYCALFNTRAFSRLLKVYSDQVAGGQSNLSARFTRKIPLPDLSSVQHIGLIDQLASMLDADDVVSNSWLYRADKLAAQAWGAELVAALVEMDDA